MRTADDLTGLEVQLEIGDEAEVTYERDGRSATVAVTVGSTAP